MFWVFNLLIFIFFIKLSLYASTTDAQQVTKRQNFKDLKTETIPYNLQVVNDFLLNLIGELKNLDYLFSTHVLNSCLHLLTGSIFPSTDFYLE